MSANIIAILKMKATYFVLLCALLDQSETKCNTLLMCPSFCMKVKNGCYVCDCGMFSHYLHRASDEMAAESDRQTSQTGTKLSSFTSGYDGSVDGKGSPNVQNNQRLQDYSRVLYRFYDDQSNMQLGFQYMNVRPQPMVSQNVGMSASNFINYGHNYQNMPGMNCVPVDDTCPSSCWNTDVFTGCVHCACAHVINIPKPAQSSKETTTQRAPTAVTPVESLNWMDKHGQKTPTSLPRVITSFTSRTSRANEVSKSEPLSTTKPLPQSNTYNILVPTKPPTPPSPRTPPAFTPPAPTIPSATTVFRIDAERRIAEVTGRSSTPQIGGYLIPTPLPKVKAFLSAFHPQYDWRLIETDFQSKESSKLRPTMGVRITPGNFGYLTPTPLPKAGQSSHSNVSQKSVWKFTENVPVDLGQEIIGVTTQTKIRVQSPGDLATTSSIMDALREPTNNTDSNTSELWHRIKQSTISSKLERPLNPLITVKTTGYQTRANNTNSFLIHQSLPYTGTGDYFSDSISYETSANTNRVGFYAHSETG